MSRQLLDQIMVLKNEEHELLDQIERMRPVVEAAVKHVDIADKRRTCKTVGQHVTATNDRADSEVELSKVVRTYRGTTP